MADDGIWCKNANIQARTGLYANATANATAWTDTIVLDCEAFVNALTNVNWSDIYSTLNVDKRYILMDAAASWAAILVMNYDLSGWPSRTAETKLDILTNRFWAAIKLLQTSQGSTFVQAA